MDRSLEAAAGDAAAAEALHPLTPEEEYAARVDHAVEMLKAEVNCTAVTPASYGRPL